MKTDRNQNNIDLEFGRVFDGLDKLRKTLTDTIIGQEHVIEFLLTAFFSRGHVLLEGLPGLGKTHLAKALASAAGLDLSRIQCTPDLLPADITGSEIIIKDSNALEFRPGPIFSSLVLVDEINRSTPKTQAALLEAMQENQVTYIGKQYKLPEPFWLLATQNPIELEGTYPLPEAQLDRFTMKLNVSTPSADSWSRILDATLDDEPADHIEKIISPDLLQAILKSTREVVIAEPVKQAAVDLILACHPESDNSSELAKKHIQYGPSPRGLQSLMRTSRVYALLNGRTHVSVDDIGTLILPVLRHRIILTIESEMQGISVESVIRQIKEEWIKAR